MTLRSGGRALASRITPLVSTVWPHIRFTTAFNSREEPDGQIPGLFSSEAMVVTDGEPGAAGRAARAVIDEAKAAGVYVFTGGIDEDVPAVLVSADGAVATVGNPWAPALDGGFTALELPSRD